ncbi:hypothetical protein FKG94_15300 [Exilibacterium tricleocarpae]|uniref:histidine kinase n=1 Tax=Exilibacterium tricleocarpae TaxID=2591008 RepID=A0A545TFV3_9GAMM|nr:ATP-binding protein [Exilibacterium tricleocarpae]TQV76085.1 hypothetical protein FKG94_15300 [Exilibacterium tricleocarpae]
MTAPMPKNESLTDQVSLPEQLPDAVGESVWIEVIQRMDTIYADLVHHQVELEEKNTALEQTYRQLQQTHEELKNTQQQLVQAEKMASLGRLVAGVAHELNNPISFILGNTHALAGYNRRLQTFFSGLEKLADPRVEELRRHSRIDRLLNDLDPLVEGSMEGAQRVGDIVDSLLRFTNPQPRQIAQFDICRLAHTATQWVLRAARNKPAVHFDMPESLNFYGYEGPVHQILVNLVHNAVDASENVDAPALWLTLQRQPQQLLISVRDNGAGIDPEHLNTIFDPFFTTKQSGKGTGLGLYISYLLATEQCGGQLRADNHIDGGAVFELTLPLNQQPLNQQPLNQQSLNRQGGECDRQQ